MSKELWVNGQALVFVSACCTVAMTTCLASLEPGELERVWNFPETSTRGVADALALKIK